MVQRKVDRMDWFEAALLLVGLGSGILIVTAGRRMINSVRRSALWKRWHRERRPIAEKGPLDRYDEAVKSDPEKIRPLTKQARNRKLWQQWAEESKALKRKA